MFTVSNVLINGNHTTEGQLIHIQGDVIHQDGFHKETNIRIYCNGNLVGGQHIDTESLVDDKFYFVIPVNQLTKLKDVNDTFAFSMFLDHNEPVKPVWRTTVYLDDVKLEQVLNYNRNIQGFESLLRAINTLERVGSHLAVSSLHKGESKTLVKGKFFGVDHELSIHKDCANHHWVWKRGEEEIIIPNLPYALLVAIGRHYHPSELITGKEAYSFASFIFHGLSEHQDENVRERFANVCQRTALHVASTQSFENIYTRLTREGSMKKGGSRMTTVPGLYSKNLSAHTQRVELGELADEYNDLAEI